MYIATVHYVHHYFNCILAIKSRDIPVFDRSVLFAIV